MCSLYWSQSYELALSQPERTQRKRSYHVSARSMRQSLSGAYFGINQNQLMGTEIP